MSKLKLKIIFCRSLLFYILVELSNICEHNYNYKMNYEQTDGQSDLKSGYLIISQLIIIFSKSSKVFDA